jgi:hypothetical protein
MTTYSRTDFEQVAIAIGRDLATVLKYEKLFECAADWYRLEGGLPSDKPRPRHPPTPPSKMREKLHKIAKRAQQLLKALGATDQKDVNDEAASFEIVEILAAAQQPSEDVVVNAKWRIEYLMTLLEAIEAAGELERRAQQAAEDVVSLGRLIVPKGHQGDAAVNNWIAVVMEAYERITGNRPRTSVVGANQPNEGIASGPLIRFLQAAGKPLGIRHDEDACRSRIRTILQSH